MKLRFLALTFALVAPLAACSSNTPISSNAIQSPTPQSSSSPTQNWYNYTAKDGSYTAKFPHQPKELNNSRQTKIGELKFVQVMYEDKAKGRVYMTQSNKFPINSEQLNVEKGLDGFRDGQTKDGSTVISDKKISLNGLPGKEIILRLKNGTVMKQQAFIDTKGPTLYVVAVGAGNGNLNFPEAQPFMNSFAVQK